MKYKLIISSALLAQSVMAVAENNALTRLHNEFLSQGAIAGDAQKGKQFWNATHPGKAPFTQRSCSSCHTSNLTNKGKHVKTGKAIEPLAPSVNKQSLTEVKKITKWFKRNCKWTLGRECSAQEKIDILTFLSQQ